MAQEGDGSDGLGDETTPLAADASPSPLDESCSCISFSLSSEFEDEVLQRIDSTKIAFNLKKVQKDSLRLRLRISGPPFVLGFICVVFAVVTMIVNLQFFSPALFATSITSAVCGCGFTLMSLLPADHNAVKFGAVAWSLASLSLCAVFAWCTGPMFVSAAQGRTAVWDLCFGCIGASLVLYEGWFVYKLLSSALRLRTRTLLYLMWRMFAGFCGSWGVALLLHAAVDFYALRHAFHTGGYFAAVIVRCGVGPYGRYAEAPWWPWMGPTGAILCLLALLLARRSPPYMPGCVYAWLASMGREVSLAASIASAIGSSDVEAVIQRAKSRCRAVPLDSVSRELFFSNQPMDMESFKRCGLPIRLGEIDAFISHSWHDDPDAKWEALQAWRQDFKKRHGREPHCWIDKFCIDQANIMEDLTCLPVYLAGSRSLVILHGSTYLRRLWCIMELLIFVLMGGHIEDVALRRVAGDNFVPAEAVANFAVSDATCTQEQDKDMLFAIVEAGFQNFDSFDRTVRELMTDLERSAPVP
eukprot:TRINITY_DN55865_c0_g1_i1.p1 TRINITY_DN55865_c0_g1~~TRINITY_DN55865_c0_g1_i1.p1  ORF type:complete len:541 (+),score=103.33 TRINITY_DN55865_c0_g1_i1:40-1623(+)